MMTEGICNPLRHGSSLWKCFWYWSILRRIKEILFLLLFFFFPLFFFFLLLTSRLEFQLLSRRVVFLFCFSMAAAFPTSHSLDLVFFLISPFLLHFPNFHQAVSPITEQLYLWMNTHASIGSTPSLLSLITTVHDWTLCPMESGDYFHFVAWRYMVNRKYSRFCQFEWGKWEVSRNCQQESQQKGSWMLL